MGVINSGSTSDEWKAFLLETQEQALRTYRKSMDLGRRGSAAARSVVALLSEWSTVRVRSETLIIEFRGQYERAQYLAREFSSWIQEHPETEGDFLKNAIAELRDSSKDEKISFIEQFRDERKFRLEHQLPELEEIVDQLEISTQRLRQIVSLASQ